MNAKTYTPLNSAGPAVVAGLVLLAGYVVGPALGHLLMRRTEAKCLDVLQSF